MLAEKILAHPDLARGYDAKALAELVLAEAHPEPVALPSLTVGGGGDDIDCEHRWTSAELDARPALWREGVKPGDLCREEVTTVELVEEYRPLRTWTSAGQVALGETRRGDGSETTVSCLRGHRFQVPDFDYLS